MLTSSSCFVKRGRSAQKCLSFRTVWKSCSNARTTLICDRFLSGATDLSQQKTDPFRRLVGKAGSCDDVVAAVVLATDDEDLPLKLVADKGGGTVRTIKWVTPQ